MDKNELSDLDLNVIKSAIAFVKVSKDDTRNLYIAALLDIIEKFFKDKWQPIETAPKDGTEFYGWGTIINDDGNIHHPIPGRHYDCYWGNRDSDYVKRKYGPQGWCTRGHDGWSYGIVLIHWQPLPAPPMKKGE